nr:MAG TPA: Mannosyl-glycoprotein endo-beta-N-acetylglucosaminidase [Caudoviricetes sp.]
MKLDELFERLRPVGASREAFQAGSKFETLLSNLESKLEKAMQFSMEKDEDLYPIFEEQRQALQEVAKNLANLRKNKDEDSVIALKESLATEAKTSKIARKIISDRPDEDKLKFDSNLEASMIIKSSQEQLNQLMSEIDSFREITKENKDSVVELSKTFKKITSDLNKDNKLGAAVTAIAPITKKFDVGDKSERIEESISVIDESDDKDLDLGSGKNSKSELQSIRELLEKKLYETKTQESNLLLENLNLTKKERNDEDSEERVSDNIIIKKLDEFSDELDALDMRDGEFQSVEGEVDNKKTSTEVDLKEPDFEIKEVESDRNVDSIERANADSETYLSELSEDQTYKQDIASIREDVSKILALMGEGESSEKSDSEEDSDGNSKGSGGGFSLGSFLGLGKMKDFMTSLGPALANIGKMAGPLALIAGELVVLKKVSDKLDAQIDENAKIGASLDVFSNKEDMSEAEREQLKQYNYKKYGTYNPSDEEIAEYAYNQEPWYNKVIGGTVHFFGGGDEEKETKSRVSLEKAKDARAAKNLARYGSVEKPNKEQIDLVTAKSMGLSLEEYNKAKSIRAREPYEAMNEEERSAYNRALAKQIMDETSLNEDDYKALSVLYRKKLDYSQGKLKTSTPTRTQSEVLLDERDAILDSFKEEGREINSDAYRESILKLGEKYDLSQSQIKMLTMNAYGERENVLPSEVNPALYENEWAQELREAYKAAGITNEDALNYLIAQDALESNWGKSEQSRKSNNYGNITAGSRKKGIFEGDDTDADGNPIKQKFRKYKDINEYAVDKVSLLKGVYDFDENDDFETFIGKVQGKNKKGKSYATSRIYKQAVASRLYGESGKNYITEKQELTEDKLRKLTEVSPDIQSDLSSGGFEGNKWVDSGNYSTLESGDIVSFKDTNVIPEYLGFKGVNRMPDGRYQSILVDKRTLKPAELDEEGNVKDVENVMSVKTDTPEYQEIIRRNLKEREYEELPENFKDSFVRDMEGNETSLTQKQRLSHINYMIAAAKNSKKKTAGDVLARYNLSKQKPIIGNTISTSGDMMNISIPVEGEDYDLSKVNLGEGPSKQYKALDLNYVENDDWVVDMATLNGGNVIKAEPLDDLRGEYKTDENGNRHLDRGYEGEPNLDIRSDMTKSIQSGFKKATSKLSDWFTFQKKAKVQESQSIDMNRVASIEKDIEDAAVKKIEVVQGAKPSLPALKPIEVKEKKEEKKILDKKQPTSTVITNITTFNSVDSLMRDDIGNIGTA